MKVGGYFLIFWLNILLFVIAEQLIENNRLIGIDTIHGSKIDKDTIITSNLKMTDKTETKNGKSRIRKLDERREPDWSYEPVPRDVSTHVLEFKRNMSECLKEVQQEDKTHVKRLSPKESSPIHGECLIACVLKRNGVIGEGKIWKENLMSLLSKFYAKNTKLMKKLEKNVDRCIDISVHIDNECKLASTLNECTNDLMVSNKQHTVINY
ncbi:hypothetical protein ACJJTC_013111 [Scirpophaga incertulas]